MPCQTRAAPPYPTGFLARHVLSGPGPRQLISGCAGMSSTRPYALMSANFA